jgi:hypothetical protein
MERIGKHLSYANVAATLALVFAMSGGAIAATGGFSSGGSLRACANEEGGIKLLRAGKHCRKGQKTVAWNQTGPAGAKGATGAAGAPGAAGATGATGAAGTPAVTVWAEVNAVGQIIGGSGATSVSGNLAGRTVTFSRDVSKCAITATLFEGSAIGVYASHAESADQIIFAATTSSGAPASGGVTVLASC